MKPTQKLITPRVRRLVRAAIKRILAEPKMYDQFACHGAESKCRSPNCVGDWIAVIAKEKSLLDESYSKTICRALWPDADLGDKWEACDPFESAVLRFYDIKKWPTSILKKVRQKHFDFSTVKYFPTPRQAKLRMEHWLKTDGRE